MSTKILKYPLELVTYPQQLQLPSGSHILSAGFQFDVPVVWVMLDSREAELGKNLSAYYVVLVPTGHEMPFEYTCWRFLNTIINEDSFALHAFTRRQV